MTRVCPQDEEYVPVRHQILVFVLLLIGGLFIVSGSSTAQSDSATETAQSTVAAPTSSPTPTPLLTNMVLWWPDALWPATNGDAAEILAGQISDFQASQGNVEVELRLKKVTGLGGILSTLRAASPVAPGALPDLTLMRREDLLAAADSGLIHPLEGEISTAILGDLYPTALALGQINGELYGLPYLVEVQHMAYRPMENLPPSSSFADILANQIRFALPAAQTEQINNLLLNQYIDAGGQLPGATGGIDVDALRRTLQFYQDAVDQKLIDPGVLNYTSPSDYEDALLAGDIDAGVISSTGFLQLLQSGQNLNFGPVPTYTGSTLGEIDGWMWVMTTSSADRQALAARFLNYILNATRQGDYSRSIQMIPSQRTAFHTWDESSYTAFVRELLDSSLLPITDEEGGTVARAIQNALVAVLSGQSTAEEATLDLIDRLQDS